MPSPKTYNASCHCGQITYTVTLPEPLAPEGEGELLVCNCSICTKNGYLLVYPKREDVVFDAGCWEKTGDYRMGKKNKAHRFCPTCSSSLLIDWQNSDVESQRPFLAMNARLFEGIDLAKAKFAYYDGWSNIEPAYGRGVARRAGKADDDEGKGRVGGEK